MPDEPVPQNLLDSIKDANNGSRFLRMENGEKSDLAVETINPINNPDIGAKWDGVGFLSPSPGNDYMLDYTGYNWVLVPPNINNPGIYSWDEEQTIWISE